MKNASMKDVATLANVSTATVSHVINGSRNVNLATQQKVNDAIKALAYQVNPTARKLRNGSSRLVGFLTSNLSHYFYIEIGMRIERILNANGYQLFFVNSEETAEKEKRNLQNYVLENLAGLIIVPVELDWKFLEPIMGKMPCVFIDRKPIGIKRDIVLSTNHAGAFDVTNLLLGKGAKKIAFICSRFDNTMAERLSGYEDALRMNGIGINKELEFIGTDRPMLYGEIRICREWDELLDKAVYEEKIDAILSGNDLFAFYAVNYFARKHIDIPHDLLFSTFDSPYWMYTSKYQVISISQDEQAIGEYAAKVLLKRIKGDTSPFMEYRVKTKIVTINKSE
ncbi:LacI family DNA-binding transcriptional regulator [uncultured Sphaerochaeta sp.]|uniref:LacI family DNA-binding transcriptional regulator n=1 Tax=uncultured Sphaerochaeta sp. TaxID=886478 RepID=UPI00374A5FB8